jgi:cysteine desulfurase
LKSNGGEVTFVPVEENGIVDPQKIKAALKPNTVLVSVMLANNEIGTIQPIREISRVIQEYKQKEQFRTAQIPYFHTDASQAANYLDLSFQNLASI